MGDYIVDDDAKHKRPRERERENIELHKSFRRKLKREQKTNGKEQATMSGEKSTMNVSETGHERHNLQCIRNVNNKSIGYQEQCNHFDLHRKNSMNFECSILKKEKQQKQEAATEMKPLHCIHRRWFLALFSVVIYSSDSRNIFPFSNNASATVRYTT